MPAPIPLYGRAAVEQVREALGRDRVSERWARRVLGHPRPTQRRERYVSGDEPRLAGPAAKNADNLHWPSMPQRRERQDDSLASGPGLVPKNESWLPSGRARRRH